MRMIFGAIGGIKFGRGNRSTRRKPTPAPLCPPQNPTWQIRSRTPDRSGGNPVTNRLSYGAAMGEWIYRSNFFFTSALVGGEWSASLPSRFTPGERAADTHWIGGWVDPRAGLDDVEKRKFLALPWLEIRPLSRQHVASRYTYYASLDPYNAM
jgi:hypothetical protein